MNVMAVAVPVRDNVVVVDVLGNVVMVAIVIVPEGRYNAIYVI